MNSTDKINVALQTGMVGPAMVRTLRSRGFNDTVVRTSCELVYVDDPAEAALIVVDK